MTTTFLKRPLSIYMAPVVSAYRKPEQAALISKPQAFFAPVLSHTMLAVAGITYLRWTVATIRQSISSGLIPRLAHISSNTGTHRSEVPLAFPPQYPSFFNARAGADPFIICIDDLLKVGICQLVFGYISSDRSDSSGHFLAHDKFQSGDENIFAKVGKNIHSFGTRF